MQKFLSFTLLLCCGLLWNVNVHAQDAIASVKKQDCKMTSAKCASASTAAVSTKSANCRPATSTAATTESSAQGDDNSSAAYAAANLEALYTASYVALVGTQPGSANCNPTNCKPVNCKPASCDPANCDPNDCPPACKRACASTSVKTSTAKTGQKLQ